ncbi:MAG: hypothetical protein CR987_00690 [Draconibacterium sp.]|nr:MAG: hypothetical protein CR987_00690 [Draconibacterium sp.]
MENWTEKNIATIEEKLKDASTRDKRFFRIDELKRNVERVGQFSDSCGSCNKLKNNIEEVVKIIDIAVEQPGKNRRNFDKTINQLSKHMQKQHHFYAPYYFTYLFSFWGIIIGSLIGGIPLLFVANDKLLILSIGFSLGMIVGYFIGNSKDSKIRKENRLL